MMRAVRSGAMARVVAPWRDTRIVVLKKQILPLRCGMTTTKATAAVCDR